MHDEPAFELGYRPALDGLRAVAVVAVLSHHALLPFAGGGFLGVALFFTLSGFLITYLLCTEVLRTGTIRLRTFYLRRILRLMPALALLAAALMVFAGTWLGAASRARIAQQVAAAMFYVTNWLIAFEWWPKLALLAHTWSLSIEEQFYSLWPALLLLTFRGGRTPRLFFSVIALSFVGSAVARGIVWLGSDSYVRAYYGSATNADMLLTGCGVGALVALGKLPTSPHALATLRYASWVAAVFLLLMCGLAKVDAGYMYLGGFTLVAVASAVLILSVVALPDAGIARFLACPPLVAIGRISYGLYLWHFPVYMIAHSQPTTWSHAVVQAAAIAATFAFAGASYLLVETRFLRLKNKLGS